MVQESGFSDEPWLAGLNDAQREAALARDPVLAVMAGPGTGKTRTLAARVAALLSGNRARPGEILAVTFTRSAAREMRERLGSRAAAARVETLHAFCLWLLKREAYPFGGAPRVAGEEDKARFLEGLVSPGKRASFLEDIGRAKRRGTALAPLQARYQGRLEARGFLDFDDVLGQACRLLRERPETAARLRREIRFVMVDEFQDTSPVQYDFLGLLGAENAFVIGDPDQAIYDFSNGSFDPFARFVEDRPSCRVLRLSENYRSQGVILKAAAQVISRNGSGSAPAARIADGLPIEISRHISAREEAHGIARKIEGLLGGASHLSIDTLWAGKDRESYSYGLSEIAVLYRFHVQGRLIAQALDRAGLPYRRFGGETAEEDYESMLADEESAPGARRGEWISLMTFHRAKGLEFPVVFAAGLEEGILPRPAQGCGEGGLAAERRLFYVGLTRAGRRLFLSCAGKRFLFGELLKGGASRFLGEIEQALLMRREAEAGARRRRSGPDPQMMLDI